MKILPVIMSGGAGTRLWPMSRGRRPKQFLPLASDQSLFQETVLRVSTAHDGKFLAPVIIGAARHGDLIAEELGAIGVKPTAIIGEPAPRNTAPVAAISALFAAREDEDVLILLMPADHHIEDARGFRAAVMAGASAAASGHIVTFGIKPTEPHTGFGYIQSAEKITPGVFSVAAFKEKPDAKTAGDYLNDGGYFWNAGIFLYSAKAMLAECATHAPEILQAAEAALANADKNGSQINLAKSDFEACPSDSIDYAIMENTQNAAVVGSVDVGWSDIGSWTAISNAAPDEQVVAAVDCSNTLIQTDGVFVGAVGLEDMIVIATGDAVLVAPRDRAQDVKTIVEHLKSKGRDDLL